ncbi:uncharacterized protein LOC123321954 [Coccinella septempunctata]|uniref:uncharacterized protein LOC123321954 n=1 Tax=Coccinella septempunctata TaxID=41139 RepID=UPI001D06CCEA|nr:uncharacterized protein LOC123321954 [Coccinella septempunctata]
METSVLLINYFSKGLIDFSNVLLVRIIFLREYIIVDFPEEKTEDGIPMALISSDWVFEEGGNLYCFWPTYLKSTTQIEKAVINHQILKYDKCLKCPVAIKYSTDDYKKASLKLRLLEEGMQSQSEESSSQLNSKVVRGNRNEDFIYSDESFDEEDMPPVPPKLKIASSIPAPKRDMNKTIRRKTYSVLKPVQPFRVSEHNINEPSTNVEPSVELMNDNKSSTCSCEQNTKILTNLVREIQILKDDIRHLLRLHVEDRNG